MPAPVGVLSWINGLPALGGRPASQRRRPGSARSRLAAPPAPAGNAAPPPESLGRHSDGQAPEEDGAPASSQQHDAEQQQHARHARDGLHVPGAKASVATGVGLAAVLSGARSWGFLLKAVTVHGANLAASLAARPLAPLQARMQAQLASMEAVQAACSQLGVDSLADLQDLMNCVLLSEHVYKIVDHSTEVSVQLLNSVKSMFPPHLATLRGVQWAQPHVRHRFLLGESDDALYVCFMGTKLPRDMAANLALFQEEVVLDMAMLSSPPVAADLGQGGAGGAAGRPLAAHRGFLTRARSIPIRQLYAEARARGKRLVLCGHSLGGAVASLCAIKLLQHLPPSQHHTVGCYGFATPPLGNEALAATVAEAGWGARIRNYLSPDDPIPKLLSFRRAEAGEAAAAPATVPAPAAAHAAAPAPPAAAAAAAAAPSAAANNIQAAPQLGSAAGAQARLRRIASQVGAAAAAEPTAAPAEHQQAQQRGVQRSASAPVLLTSAAVEAVEQHLLAAEAGEGAAADGSTAAPSSAHGTKPGGPQRWLGRRLAAAAAPVVQRAGSAARLVALPLSAAASVPMRAAPQYVPLGRQLFIQPGAVTATKPPPGQPSPWDGAAAAAAAGRPTLPLLGAAASVAGAAPEAAARTWTPPFWPRPAPPGLSSGSQDDDIEDNVDVAAAAGLQQAAAIAGLSGDEGGGAGGRRRRRDVFGAHRMSTYRNRLLSICQGSLEGHLMLRALPMLPSLPRPGDVVASELLAPPFFPLRATATVESLVAAAAVAHGEHLEPVAAAAGAMPGGAAGEPADGLPPGWRPFAFWRRLLARAAGQQWRGDAPVELLIRVEGRGLANVTHAWVEGTHPALPVPPPLVAAGKGGGTAPPPPAVTLPSQVALVDIVQQPRAGMPPPPLQGARQPLAVLTQLSAFVSWVAATLGWVALLRQLQPAGRSDFLLARVRLPASAVREAHLAARSSLLTSVADGPLLHGIALGPRLSLRLQSDFASHSLPLDIRIAAEAGGARPGWQWPWQPRPREQAARPHGTPAHQAAPRRRRRKPQPPAAGQAAEQQQQRQEGSGRWWWEWPSGQSAAGGH